MAINLSDVDEVILTSSDDGDPDEDEDGGGRFPVDRGRLGGESRRQDARRMDRVELIRCSDGERVSSRGRGQGWKPAELDEDGRRVGAALSTSHHPLAKLSPSTCCGADDKCTCYRLIYLADDNNNNNDNDDDDDDKEEEAVLREPKIPADADAELSDVSRRSRMTSLADQTALSGVRQKRRRSLDAGCKPALNAAKYDRLVACRRHVTTTPQRLTARHIDSLSEDVVKAFSVASPPGCVVGVSTPAAGPASPSSCGAQSSPPCDGCRSFQLLTDAIRQRIVRDAGKTAGVAGTAGMTDVEDGQVLSAAADELERERRRTKPRSPVAGTCEECAALRDVICGLTAALRSARKREAMLGRKVTAMSSSLVAFGRRQHRSQADTCQTAADSTEPRRTAASKPSNGDRIPAAAEEHDRRSIGSARVGRPVSIDKHHLGDIRRGTSASPKVWNYENFGVLADDESDKVPTRETALECSPNAACLSPTRSSSVSPRSTGENHSESVDERLPKPKLENVELEKSKSYHMFFRCTTPSKETETRLRSDSNAELMNSSCSNNEQTGAASESTAFDMSVPSLQNKQNSFTTCPKSDNGTPITAKDNSPKSEKRVPSFYAVEMSSTDVCESVKTFCRQSDLHKGSKIPNINSWENDNKTTAKGSNVGKPGDCSIGGEERKAEQDESHTCRIKPSLSFIIPSASSSYAGTSTEIGGILSGANWDGKCGQSSTVSPGTHRFPDWPVSQSGTMGTFARSTTEPIAVSTAKPPGNNLSVNATLSSTTVKSMDSTNSVPANKTVPRIATGLRKSFQNRLGLASVLTGIRTTGICSSKSTLATNVKTDTLLSSVYATESQSLTTAFNNSPTTSPRSTDSKAYNIISSQRLAELTREQTVSTESGIVNVNLTKSEHMQASATVNESRIHAREKFSAGMQDRWDSAEAETSKERYYPTAGRRTETAGPEVATDDIPQQTVITMQHAEEIRAPPIFSKAPICTPTATDRQTTGICSSAIHHTTTNARNAGPDDKATKALTDLSTSHAAGQAAMSNFSRVDHKGTDGSRDLSEARTSEFGTLHSDTGITQSMTSSAIHKVYNADIHLDSGQPTIGHYRPKQMDDNILEENSREIVDRMVSHRDTTAAEVSDACWKKMEEERDAAVKAPASVRQSISRRWMESARQTSKTRTAGDANTTNISGDVCGKTNEIGAANGNDGNSQSATQRTKQWEEDAATKLHQTRYNVVFRNTELSELDPIDTDETMNQEIDRKTHQTAKEMSDDISLFIHVANSANTSANFPINDHYASTKTAKPEEIAADSESEDEAVAVNSTDDNAVRAKSVRNSSPDGNGESTRKPTANESQVIVIYDTDTYDSDGEEFPASNVHKNDTANTPEVDLIACDAGKVTEEANWPADKKSHILVRKSTESKENEPRIDPAVPRVDMKIGAAKASEDIMHQALQGNTGQPTGGTEPKTIVNKPRNTLPLPLLSDKMPPSVSTKYVASVMQNRSSVVHPLSTPNKQSQMTKLISGKSSGKTESSNRSEEVLDVSNDSKSSDQPNRENTESKDAKSKIPVRKSTVTMQNSLTTSLSKTSSVSNYRESESLTEVADSYTIASCTARENQQRSEAKSRIPTKFLKLPSQNTLACCTSETSSVGDESYTVALSQSRTKFTHGSQKMSAGSSKASLGNNEGRASKLLLRPKASGEIASGPRGGPTSSKIAANSAAAVSDSQTKMNSRIPVMRTSSLSKPADDGEPRSCSKTSSVSNEIDREILRNPRLVRGTSELASSPLNALSSWASVENLAASSSDISHFSNDNGKPISREQVGGRGRMTMKVETKAVHQRNSSQSRFASCGATPCPSNTFLAADERASRTGILASAVGTAWMQATTANRRNASSKLTVTSSNASPAHDDASRSSQSNMAADKIKFTVNSTSPTSSHTKTSASSDKTTSGSAPANISAIGTARIRNTSSKLTVTSSSTSPAQDEPSRSPVSNKTTVKNKFAENSTSTISNHTKTASAGSDKMTSGPVNISTKKSGKLESLSTNVKSAADTQSLNTRSETTKEMKSAIRNDPEIPPDGSSGKHTSAISVWERLSKKSGTTDKANAPDNPSQRSRAASCTRSGTVEKTLTTKKPGTIAEVLSTARKTSNIQSAALTKSVSNDQAEVSGILPQSGGKPVVVAMATEEIASAKQDRNKKQDEKTLPTQKAADSRKASPTDKSSNTREVSRGSGGTEKDVSGGKTGLDAQKNAVKNTKVSTQNKQPAIAVKQANVDQKSPGHTTQDRSDIDKTKNAAARTAANAANTAAIGANRSSIVHKKSSAGVLQQITEIKKILESGAKLKAVADKKVLVTNGNGSNAKRSKKPKESEMNSLLWTGQPMVQETHKLTLQGNTIEITSIVPLLRS